MRFLLALLVVAPVALLVVGRILGRAEVRSCCALPAERDLRLADATTRDASGAHDAQMGAPSAPAH